LAHRAIGRPNESPFSSELEALFSSKLVGIATIDQTGRFLDVNDTFCSMIGYTRRHLLGTSFFNITHPEDVDPNRRYLQQLASGKIRQAAIEDRYIHQHGTSVWVHNELFVVHNARGPRILMISIEVTHLKEVELRIKSHIDSRVATKAPNSEPPVSRASSKERQLYKSLSSREQQVLKLLALGHTGKEAARELGVSLKTVETYRMRIAEKLGLRSRSDMVSFAVRAGVFPHGT